MPVEDGELKPDSPIKILPIIFLNIIPFPYLYKDNIYEYNI